MALVTFVEIDGQRVEITDLTQHQEARCDGCGQYGDDATLTTIRLSAAPVGGTGSTVLVHHHEGHRDAAMESGLAHLAAAVKSWPTS